MRVLSLIAILVGSIFVFGVIQANATSNTLRGSEPAWPKWSRAKPPTTDKMKMKILEEKLAKLGCKLKCTRGARLLTREKSKAAEQFVKFVHFAHETLEAPTNASLAHANALKQDVMFYVSDVWQQLAEAEVASTIDKKVAILDSMDFEARIRGFMKLLKEGPSHYQRGLVGGAVMDYKCMSGAALAGAVNPVNGGPICIPVLGHVQHKVQCANFAMVPNGVLKTLSPNEFVKICESMSHCQYVDVEKDGSIGICVAKPENKVVLGAKKMVTQKLWERVYAMKKKMQFRKPILGKAALVNKINANKTKEDKDDDVQVVQGSRRNTTSKAAVVNATQRAIDLDPESSKNIGIRLHCSKMHEARMVSLEQISFEMKKKRKECLALKNSWKSEKTPKKVKCCEPPLSATQRKTKYFECERKIISLLTLKKEIERDLAKCTKVLHEYKCDVIYTMNQCPQKPFCRGDQVDFFRYMAEGSKKDCCNEYTCIQKGYGADISSGGLALRPMNTKNKCPDYSAVSSLETLMKHGITTDILRWYGTLCEKVDGCMYIKETNTCV
jgi:hypothetical protein